MSKNSSIPLFHLNIGTKILLTGFLRAFSVSRFNPSPGINQKSADGKTIPRVVRVVIDVDGKILKMTTSR